MLGPEVKTRLNLLSLRVIFFHQSLFINRLFPPLYSLAHR